MTNSADSTSDTWSSYPRPSVAVDVVALTVEASSICLILNRRENEPFEGWLALPGVFVNSGERLDWLENHAQETAVDRALGKIGLDRPPSLEQVFAQDHPDRDPRGWVISIAYFCLIPPKRAVINGQGRSPGVMVQIELVDGNVSRIVKDGRQIKLAFDHQSIVEEVLRRIQSGLRRSGLAFKLLPDEFSLGELRAVHETLLGRQINKDSFRRSLLGSGEVVPTGRRQHGVGHRPSELYRRRSDD
jgi:8-oxo-dGTP diphosphatase